MKESAHTESEEPPGQGRPPHPWEDVPLARWNDWRWQLSHRLNTVEDFARVIHPTPDEAVGLSTPGHFRVDVTPYFASLMDPEHPTCPIRRQVIPTAHEMTPFDGGMVDSLAEDAYSPVPFNHPKEIAPEVEYEGLISTYTQPTDYQPHDTATCVYCQASRSEGGQEGVAGLLAGQVLTIAPEGWRTLHQRGVVSPSLLVQQVSPLPGGNGRGQSQLQPDVSPRRNPSLCGPRQNSRMALMLVDHDRGGEKWIPDCV